MNDTFEMKVRAAAIAGWWALLIAAFFLTIQWIAYLYFMSSQPAWLLYLWGPGINWETVRHVWFWLMAIFKFCMWLLALLALWLTLWARQLRKRAHNFGQSPAETGSEGKTSGRYLQLLEEDRGSDRK